MAYIVMAQLIVASPFKRPRPHASLPALSKTLSHNCIYESLSRMCRTPNCRYFTFGTDKNKCWVKEYCLPPLSFFFPAPSSPAPDMLV